jgi:hypothetical protein
MLFGPLWVQEGWTKWYTFHHYQKDQILIFEIDPNLKRRGNSDKRWRYYP